jgi:hypothetical protein
MVFLQLWDYLGLHIPALGAFLCTLVVVDVLCFVFYKLGQHKANKLWQWDIEHQPNMIGQDVRERYEKRIAVLEEKNKGLRERQEQMQPAFKNLADLAVYFLDKENPR